MPKLVVLNHLTPERLQRLQRVRPDATVEAYAKTGRNAAAFGRCRCGGLVGLDGSASRAGSRAENMAAQHERRNRKTVAAAHAAKRYRLNAHRRDPRRAGRGTGADIAARIAVTN